MYYFLIKMTQINAVQHITGIP